MTGVRAFLDRLFALDDADARPTGRATLRFLAVVVLLVVLIGLRRPDAFVVPQFWAEDSTVYFWQQLTLGFRGAFRAFWNGYPNLLQRLVAWLGAQVPMASTPAVYGWSAIVTTAVAVAAFALPAFRHLVRSDLLRVVWCVAVVCLPVEQEMLGTPTNLGWYLGVWLALLSVMRLPAAWWRNVGLAVAGVVGTWSTPLGFVTAPLWLLRAWRGAARRRWANVALAAVILASLGSVALVTRDLGVDRIAVRLPSGEIFDAERETGMLVAGWVRLVADRIAGLILPPAGLHAVRASGLAAVVAAGFAALVALCVQAGRRVALPGVLAGAYFALGSLALTVVGRPALAMLTPDRIPSRYGLFPAATVMLVLIAAVDGLPRRARAAAATVAVLSCLVAWSPAFVIQPFVDRHWVSWVPRLEEKLARVSDEPLVIPMNPSWNPLAIDARQLSKEIDVRPEEIVGAIGTRGAFLQTFVSRCDHLSEVDLYLGTLADSDMGEVVLTVTDPRQGPVASVRRPRLEFGTRRWHRFYFPPVAASKDVTFTAILQAVGNEQGASVVVFGSSGNLYPAGQATLGGKLLDADATMRYGCTVPATALPRPPGFRRFPPAPAQPSGGANSR